MTHFYSLVQWFIFTINALEIIKMKQNSVSCSVYDSHPIFDPDSTNSILWHICTQVSAR